MELTGQILTFTMTIVTGILLGLLFDCYRVLRGTFHPKVWLTLFTDLLYWMMATMIVFIALIVSNWGELRLYVFIGIVSGLVFYYNWFSLYAIRIFASGIGLLIAGLLFIKKL